MVAFTRALVTDIQHAPAPITMHACKGDHVSTAKDSGATADLVTDGHAGQRHDGTSGLDPITCAEALLAGIRAAEAAQADADFYRRVAGLAAKAAGGRLEVEWSADFGEAHVTQEHHCGPEGHEPGPCRDVVYFHPGPPDGCRLCRMSAAFDALVNAVGEEAAEAATGLTPHLNVDHREIIAGCQD